MFISTGLLVLTLAAFFDMAIYYHLGFNAVVIIHTLSLIIAIIIMLKLKIFS